MSRFTTEIRFICETAAGLRDSKGYLDLDEILEAGRKQIFDFDYPIFDASYKNVLETKILKHYYTREIGEETVGLFKLRLNARMNEIMPLYNQMYKSELLSFNPFYDVNYTRSGQRTGDETKTETINTASEEKDAMTGTVGDVGSSTGSDTMTGTVADRGLSTSTGSERNEGNVTTSGNVLRTNDTEDHEKGSLEKNGENSIIEKGNGYTSGNKTNTGTEKTETKSNAETNGTSGKMTKNTGTDTDTTNRDNITDYWDYYSDTPQGTIGFIPGSDGEPQATGALADQTYLTNVRHVTDDTTGSEETKTLEHGHNIKEDITNYSNTDTTGDSTLTLNTNEATDNISRSDNTRKGTDYGKEDTILNKTGKETGTEATAGTTAETGKKETEAAGTEENTKTYDTVNAKTNVTDNTRSYDTLNHRTGNINTGTQGKAKNLEEYTEIVVGKQGTVSFSKMLQEFRETFLNIDKLIIEDLSDLFFGLWE